MKTTNENEVKARTACPHGVVAGDWCPHCAPRMPPEEDARELRRTRQ
jgi:hypothetical protein